jgi:hypothetical protein
MTEKHVLFYAAEATIITLLLCTGVLLASRALRRLNVTVQLHWSVPVALWILIIGVDMLFSQMIGPEFTLHYYFGLWTLIGGCIFWLMTFGRDMALSLQNRVRAGRRRPLSLNEQKPSV